MCNVHFAPIFCYCAFYNRTIRLKKGTNGPEGMPVRDTSSPSSRGVTGVAKLLSQPPCLLCGTALSLPAVSSSPHKTPSHLNCLLTYRNCESKTQLQAGMAQVTCFMSSDTAHSILPTPINSTKSVEAEWQPVHQEVRELGCNNFLTLLKDQVAPSSKLRLPVLLSVDTIV